MEIKYSYYQQVQNYSSMVQLLNTLYEVQDKSIAILKQNDKLQENAQNIICKIPSLYMPIAFSLQQIYNQLMGKGQVQSGKQKAKRTIDKETPDDYALLDYQQDTGCKDKVEIVGFLYKSAGEINPVYANLLCQFLQQNIFLQVLGYFQKGVKEIEKNIVDIEYSLQVCRLLTQLQIWTKFKKNNEDIMLKQPKFWAPLNPKIIQKSILDNDQTFDKTMNQFIHFISLPYSVFNKTQVGIDCSYSTKIFQMYLSLYYLVSKKDAATQCKKYLSNPIPQIALDMWNGMDKIFPMMMWSSASYPMIKYCKLFYIHKTSKEMTLAQVNEWHKNKSILKREKIIKSNPKDTDIYAKADEDQKIQIRMLCSEPLQEKTEILGKTQQLMHNTLSFLGLKKQNYDEHNQVIIHLHGGGWVAMSSNSHQMYTRRWANDKALKNTPIISIDYRLSPKYQYPCALDDCWQVYQFVVNEIQNYFNINPKKIILAGDSAGGNMALGICQLCMKYGVKLPDGLLLSYPALNLSYEQFTPSIMTSLTDIIVPLPFLDICLKLYLGQDSSNNTNKQCDPEHDSLLSPIVAPNEFFKNLPPTRIFVGEEDVLKDDQFRFLDKLISNGQNDTEMVIYKKLRHGYLNWDIPLVFPATRKCSSDAAQAMATIFFK